MASSSSSHLNLDDFARSDSSSSLRSTDTVDWRTSTTSVARRTSLIDRIGNGLQSVLRRFSRCPTSLTELELQILLAQTNLSRDEILQRSFRWRVSLSAAGARACLIVAFSLFSPLFPDIDSSSSSTRRVT
jgi:hypothetical protein